MSYEVLARKWRPQQFSDVVGQDHVVQTLKNAIESDRVSHAYMFVGPRGTGKTTTARILAKALNCAQGPTITPCDACDSCREILAGSSLDVLEIDGASNNSVDQVRDLRENCRYAPARGPYKIYVIDEVHMLSVSAFNALLKTLEEPPPHVKFFFATTDPQKVPATILSRCQRFDLRRIEAGLILGRLREITEAEGIDAADEALLAVARGAEGGLRDAESALDQLIAFRGKHIEEQDVLSVFGLVAWESMQELAGAVLAGNLPGLIGIVHGFDQQGKDLQRLVIELIDYFRNLLVMKHAPDPESLPDLSAPQKDALQAQVDSVATERLLDILQILVEAESRLRHAISRRTLLETSLIRAARAATVVSIDEILEKIEALQGQPGTGVPGAGEKKKP